MRARLALGLPLLACGPDPAFRCDSDASCGPDGRCEAVGFCSFPDPGCPSGRRFGEHADAQVARVCVPEGEGSTTEASTTAQASTTGADASSTTEVMPASTSGSTSTTGSSEESSSSSGGPSTLAEGLVLHLPLDDDFATAAGALDVSGNDLHAQCEACPTSVAGRVGQAAGFASDAVLHIADDPLLRPSRAFSVSVWALDADPTSMITQFLVGKVLSGVNNTFQISTSAGRSGRPEEIVWRVTLDPTTSHSFYVANPLEPDAWHHLAGVWDGATASLWVDGVMIGQVDAPAVGYDVGPFLVGADNNDGSFLYFWRGAIDEVRLYDRALTEPEIAELAAER